MWHDIRCVGRSLRRRPGPAAGALLVLAAGLGFNTAAFSILNTLLFRPYPYPALGELVIVRDHRLADGAHQGNPIASGDFVELRRNNRAFADVAAFHTVPLLLTGVGDPERIEAGAVSTSFFETLGARTIVGRALRSDDDAGEDDRVVLSHRYWKARFSADPALIGKAITLNGRPMTVVGVIPDNTCYPPGLDAWVPLVLTPAEQQEHASQHFLAIARLKPGVSLSVARDEMRQFAGRLATLYPSTNRGRGFDLLELRKEQYEFTEGLFVMVQVAALLVLGLATANVINLMLAHVIDRERDLTIRRALGATRLMVFNHLLLEALAVTLAAGAVGILIAFWSMPLIHAALPEGIGRWIAGWQSIRIDPTVAAVMALATLLTGAVLGCVTGWQAIRSGTCESLRDTGRTGSRRLTRARRVLIVTEVAFAMVLLVVAVVTLKGFGRVSVAFDALVPRELLKFSIALPASRYQNDQSVVEFQNRLLEQVEALPGVSHVGLIRNEPASNVSNPLTSFTIEGQAPLAPNDTPRADLQTMSAGGFETLRVRALRGRTIAVADTASSPRVAVISEAMARRFWPTGDPVGVRLRLGDSGTPWITIVGVVTDLKLNWYDPEPRPTIILPHAQAPARQMRVMVRTTTDPAELARPIRLVVSRLDPLQPVSEMRRVDDVVAESISPVRVLGLLLLIGGALAIAFSATGIYGALAHWVASRRREFGIRIALGASGAAIVGLLLTQVLTLVLVGLCIGLPLGFGGLALLRGGLFGLAVLDPATVGQVAIFIVAVATLAALMPARRARRTDPSTLLQAE